MEAQNFQEFAKSFFGIKSISAVLLTKNCIPNNIRNLSCNKSWSVFRDKMKSLFYLLVFHTSSPCTDFEEKKLNTQKY